MNAVASWLMSILGIAIIGTIVDLILPEGRMRKYTKSIFACLVVLIIVMPIPSLIKNGFQLKDGELIYPDFELNQDYIENADKIKYNFLAKGVEKQLSEDGLGGVKIEITGTFSNGEPQIEGVRANIADMVIDGDFPHINRSEEVRKRVAGYLKIGEDKVIVYE